MSAEHEAARERLEPCPFCGAQVRATKDPNWSFVRCEECGCEGPDAARHNTAEAIAAWNRRAEGRLAAEECRRTASELRATSNGDCAAIEQALHWERKAAEFDGAPKLDRRRAPQPVGERERIARIIDPWAFHQCEWAIAQDNDDVLRRYLPQREAALSKADAILGGGDHRGSGLRPSALASGGNPSLEEPESAAGASSSTDHVALQCRAVAHLARSLADVHADYADLIDSGALTTIREIVGARSAGLMETLGDILNGMDAVTEDDDWMKPVFAEARRLWPPTPPPRSEAEAVQNQPQDTHDLRATSTLQGAQGDPAGSAPAYPAPRRGEVRVLDGKLCRFIEPDDKGDVWEVLGPAPLPAPHRDADGLEAGGE